MFISDALIISKRVIAANQLATLLKANGFIPKVEFNCSGIYQHHPEKGLTLLITDIDDPQIQAITIANRFRDSRPGLAWFALSSGGDKVAMRNAQAFMVGGFFFLTNSGLELDRQRGAARYLSGSGAITEVKSSREQPMQAFNTFGTPSGFFPA